MMCPLGRACWPHTTEGPVASRRTPVYQLTTPPEAGSCLLTTLRSSPGSQSPLSEERRRGSQVPGGDIPGVPRRLPPHHGGHLQLRCYLSLSRTLAKLAHRPEC